nr:class B sortase [uncultured Acetatifactor sp.]
MRKMDKDAGGNKVRVWRIAGLAFLIAAIACTVVACAGKARQEEAKEQYESLAELTTTVEPTPEPSSEEESQSSEEVPEEVDPMKELEDKGVTIPEKQVDFEDLQENVNKDIYAWIYIPDTKVDYPVLQHDSDNTYYLNYNLDGSRGYPGCIYTENYNAKDFTDPVTVVYGHNMKDGSMFAGLHRYSDIEFMEEHPYIYMYTPEGLLVYEIFTAHETSDEHILYAHNWFEEERVMEEYIYETRDVRLMGSVQREDVDVESDDHILTLSTCVSNPNNRFIVQGVLLNGSEE